MGPFYADTDLDGNAARQCLNDLEQVRWVLGSLLEKPDLKPVFPVRLLVTDAYPPSPLFPAKADLRDQHFFVLKPGSASPKADVARLLLADNMPLLPRGVEEGLGELFDTLQANGSRVRWGGSPAARPTIDFARMQLFATKFEYGASFHIFLTSLRSASTLQAAASNAFGKSWAELDSEAAARLKANIWQAVAVSGRPLDPRRDLGEHSVSGEQVASWSSLNLITSEPHPPDPACRSAHLWLQASRESTGEEALRWARRAAELNGRWAEPLVREAELTAGKGEREALLNTATELDRRNPDLWVALAQAQSANGRGAAAQASWLRAEGATQDEARQQQIHEMRMKDEAARLDSLEATRDAEREAAYETERKAERAQSARVRAAERAANRQADTTVDAGSASDAVSWTALAEQKTVRGSLTAVECTGKDSATLVIHPADGSTLRLAATDFAKLRLSCGPQKPPLRVTASYAQDTLVSLRY